MSTATASQPSPRPASGSSTSNNNSRVALAASAAHTSPLAPNVRSAINAALLANNSIPTIQAALLHECQASGFVAAVKARVLELLRSGECASYGELMATVMAELKGGPEQETFKTAAAATAAAGGVNGSGSGAAGNDNKKALVNGDAAAKGTLRVPAKVMEEGVKVVRAALEGCVDIGEDGEGGGGGGGGK